ncbi:hypothetical protein Lbys_0174 [Leadbetterella byssophila DSM 17132]|uniref:Uncharacterized protein n=1 Tax=Leadbetterella byssophila (strain DSM 17132 / JCM 16389 / KACC 11308 / NBRC 106382 / 4M15) TaxID=649349 RepID=E4RTF5_LEAB4|nr:hypothetical protein Lbys_0174 [Leadbetterella byssophila DSM 17132]
MPNNATIIKAPIYVHSFVPVNRYKGVDSYAGNNVNTQLHIQRNTIVQM